MPRVERVYEALPGPDGGWEIRRRGSASPDVLTEDAEEAVRLGTELARRHPPSRLLVWKDRERSALAREWRWPEPTPDGG